MMPTECILETLERYGEQAREVQLTLIHNGPIVCDEISRTKVGRVQPCPALRRTDAGARMWRGSSLIRLQRQSLPPLSCVRQEAEKQKEELKRSKRKSLTLLEEAWEWLESLRKGKVYSIACDKESSKRTDKRNRTSLEISVRDDKDNSGRSSKIKVRGKEKSFKPDLDHQTSCCMGNQTRGKERKNYTNSQKAKSDDFLSSNCAKDEENSLRETITCQIGRLKDLRVQIALIDRQIFELEEEQRAEKAEQEAQHRMAEEEIEQIKFWENELKAEELYEKDLQCQFLDMKAKAEECKAKLKDYKQKIHGLDFIGGQHKNSKLALNTGANAAPEDSTASAKELKQQQSDLDGDSNNRKFLPKDTRPYALDPPNQMKERRPTGPTELREWWTRWSEAQSSQSQTKKVIHRSELTIYLGSTKA
ncbi:ras association domain-containing protein 8 isoform X2 [Channa argus]